ncbi:MAG: DNA polymerase III subunit beta [Patescibacteria group bacterium]|jgi:DNA polymerase-3 subunit beta
MITIKTKELTTTLNLIHKTFASDFSSKTGIDRIHIATLPAKDVLGTGILSITAYSKDKHMSATIPCNIETDLTAYVAGSSFCNLIASLTDYDEIKLSLQDTSLKIIAKASKYVLRTANLEDFPKMPEYVKNNSVTLTAAELRKVLNNTAFCTSNDEARPLFTGLCMEFNAADNSLIVTGTDTHRMGIDKISNLQTLSLIDDNNKIIVPAKALSDAVSFLGKDDTAEILLYWNKNKITFVINNNNLIFQTALIDGQFPNCQRVVPLDENIAFSVDLPREKLEKSITRILVMAKSSKNKFNTLKCSLKMPNEVLVITTVNLDLGEGAEALQGKVSGTAIENFEIGINAQYLLDICKKTTTDNIKFDFTSNQLPIRTNFNNSAIHVLTPIRVNDMKNTITEKAA